MTPEQALIHYPLIKRGMNITPISVGLVHATYKITTPADGAFILQQLHPKLSDAGLTVDYDAVTAHLAAKNIVAQRVIRTLSGELTVPETPAPRAWRLLTFVPGRIYETLGSARQARSCAAAVATFHAALADLRHTFRSKLAFHPYNTTKFYNDFKRVIKKFSTTRHAALMAPVRHEVDFLLKEIPRLALPETLPVRIVHGDLKITNFVFNETGSSVRALIDIDTCARFPAILELADALRSWCGRAEDNPRNTFNMTLYRAALSGYEAGAPGFLSAREHRLLPRAVKLITLTLASRFLKDYFEDSYFGWNAKRYSTRRAANLARARGQIALYTDEVKKL